MKILVVNAGSSSLKYQLIEMDNESVLAKGVCERIGQDGSTLRHSGSASIELNLPMPTHKEAIKYVLDALVNKEYGVIEHMSDIAAVGHRVLHSGEDFTDSVKVTDDVLKVIESNVDLGPLHMPANIMGIKACREVMPDAPMVAVFDTTFHSTMPPYAYMYAIPYDDYKKYKIRKYGFHGTSHLYITGEIKNILKTDKFKAVICHLGNGASVSAVKDGKCIDTSMGLTPLEGLVMGTRCGDIDPAVIEYLMDKTGMDIHQATDYLNKKSGVLGVSGINSDFRDLMEGVKAGNERAKLAVDMFSYRVKKYIGAYSAALGGLDCVVFTGGIGEHTEYVREKVMSGLEYLGIDFDYVANEHPKGNCAVLSKKKSKVKVFIIPTNEELVIARETLRLK